MNYNSEIRRYVKSIIAVLTWMQYKINFTQHGLKGVHTMRGS